MSTAQKLRAKSGAVRYLSQAEIARDYPTEASADQFVALIDERDSDSAALDKLLTTRPAGTDIGFALIAVLHARCADADRAIAIIAKEINHGA